MSDMKKWIKLMESIHPVVATPPVGRGFKRDATVVLGPSVGGGTGRFVEFTTEGAALIDVKGVTREFTKEEFAIPERDLENGNDWFHMSVTDNTPGTMNDKPEFRPGDMVKVADVYGTVIGPGFGVFVGYGTTGEDCVILFDGKQIVVPVENIAAVLEQDAKDNFDQVDNDGNLSPMTFGSENVKIEQPQNSGMQSREPAMDQRDDFTKWMEAVEEALRVEGAELAEDLPPVTNECGCGSWDCPICFPSQDEMPGMNGSMDGLGGANTAVVAMDPAAFGGMPQQAAGAVCPACGNAVDDGHMHEPAPEPNVVVGGVDEFGLEEVDDNMGVDDMMDAPMEEEPQEFNQEPLPRSSDGRGVKLGDIVQHTEYRKTGEESPLTHGDELEEVVDEFDTEEPDWDADPMVVQDYHNTMAGAPQSEADVEAALDMISEIKYMQSMGLSKGDRDYSEEEMSNMGLPQLKQLHSQVTGRVAEEGIMENVDQDVAAMLASLQKYDQLVAESKKKKPDFKDVDKDGDKKEPWTKAEKDKEEVKESEDDKNPWEKKSEDKKDGDKVSKTHKGGTVTKTDTGLVHKSAKYGNQKDDVKESVEAEVDPDVLEWMARLDKIAR